jgi:hypothetical protein
MAGAGALGGGSYAQLAGAAIGTGFNILGGFMGASQADKRAAAVRRIAKTPGLDFGAALGESFENLDRFMPEYRKFALEDVEGQAEATRAGLEGVMPGYFGSQDFSREAYEQMARGELPQEELDRLAQRGAERGIAFGMPGGDFTGRLTLRDLGLEGLRYRQAGLEGLGRLRGEGAAVAPRPATAGQVFAGAMPGDVINMRANERAQRIDMLLKAAGMPTGQDVWAQTFTNIGSQLSQAANSMG